MVGILGGADGRCDATRSDPPSAAEGGPVGNSRSAGRDQLADCGCGLAWRRIDPGRIDGDVLGVDRWLACSVSGNEEAEVAMAYRRPMTRYDMRQD